MSHMLLILEPTGQRSTRTEAQGRELYARMQRFGEDLQARGKLQAVASLASQSQGVRVRTGGGGKPQVLDGPVPFVSVPWIPQLGLNLSMNMDVLGWVLTLIVTGVGAHAEIWDAAAWNDYLAAGEDTYSELEQEVIPGLF